MVAVTGEQVVDQQAVPAVRRDRLPAQFDDAARVGLEPGGRVHGGEEHAAVDAVAVVHHAPLSSAQILGGLRQPRRDHADVVALDLEVDVVGVRVVRRVPGQLGGDAGQHVLPCLPVGVPHQELRLPVRRGEVVRRSGQPLVGDHRQHRHVHVQVVFVDQPLAQRVLLHVDRAQEHAPVERELQRFAHRRAVRLAHPRAEDPVLQHHLRNPHRLAVVARPVAVMHRVCLDRGPECAGRAAARADSCAHRGRRTPQSALPTA